MRTENGFAFQFLLLTSQFFNYTYLVFIPNSFRKIQVENFLTQTVFERFLATLDAEDRERAGLKYEALRRRLLKYFEWRNCETPEELADKVFDRVARKISEGEDVRNVEAFSVTVAQFVYKEHLRGIERRNQLTEEEKLSSAKIADESETKNIRLDCLEKCLAELDVQTRCLLVEYHAAAAGDDERTMIPNRKRIAERLGISLNTLRIRVCRLKTKLEDCTRLCCGENKK